MHPSPASIPLRLACALAVGIVQKRLLTEGADVRASALIPNDDRPGLRAALMPPGEPAPGG